MASSGETRNIFRHFIDNLRLVLQQLKGGECEREAKDEFDSNDYWTHLGMVFTMMSNEATKISMLYSKPPAPSPLETAPMITSLEKTTLTLVSAYYSFPKSQGITLRKMLKVAVMDLVDSLKTLAENIADYSLGSQEQLQATGIVWHGADVFSSLPKDNKRAVLTKVEESSDLVRDALQELAEAVDNEGEADDIDDILISDGLIISNEDTWSESDKEILNVCTGLIKTAKSLLKKMRQAMKENGSCDTDANVAQFDDLADHLCTLSPAVDNMAASCYPPMNYQHIIEQADDLSTCIRNSLYFLRHSHLTCENDEQWLEFLLKANAHNKEKIHSLVDKT